MPRGPRVTVVVAVTVLVGLVGCTLGLAIGVRIWKPGPVHDPRAYSVDSGEITLKEGLRRSGIELPSCLDGDLRYALTDDNGFGYYKKIYLKFQASEEYANTFLVINDLSDTFQRRRVGGVESERQVSHREMWMDSYPVPEMGWKIGREERFQEFDSTTPTGYSMSALVQHMPNSVMFRTYVYAFRGG